jgi:uncharacterized repeat protein (TIGR01451 family)
MRRSRSVARPAPWRKAIVGLLATFVSFALLACGVAVADTVTTDFEPPTFHLGSVNGQDGWTSATPTDIPALPNGYDQEVFPVSGIDGFGTQSLRHSNAYNEPTGEFRFLTNSKPTEVEAGENALNTEYRGAFSFISAKPAALQPKLFMTMSPDDGEGGRMSGVGLYDLPGGIRALIWDTPDPTTGAFVSYDAGQFYSRDEVHTVRFWSKFVPGEDNDIVRVFIDGKDIGNELGVCFTSWENFYRFSNQAVPVTRSMIFRVSGGEVPSLVNGGFLFDNVTNTTANGPGPAGCGEDRPPPNIVIDKTTRTRVARPGDLVTYGISVRNRGDAPVRGLRACDLAPRALRFVRSRARLDRAAGRRLCLTIRLQPGQRKTFRATFRLRANVTADTVTNGASAETPVGSAPSPLPPDASPLPPDTAVIPEQRRRRVARDSTTIRVVRGVPQFVG